MNTENRKRLIRDVASILKNPLTDNGIYYTHDEENMLVGYAMIIGPDDGVYSHGYYFFKFNFPENYPYSPPKVTFYGSNSKIRFHPNLYRNGKVCLSILNTWRGEGWTSCQNIKSVLITIVSLLDKKPLLHEPGITEKHRDFNNYNQIIEYSNYRYSLLGMLYEENIMSEFIGFFSLIKTTFFQNYENIIKNLEKLETSKKNNNNETISITIYSITEHIDYKSLKEEIKNMYYLLKE